jgi:hypothetical protein
VLAAAADPIAGTRRLMKKKNTVRSAFIGKNHPNVLYSALAARD